ncbi:S-layer region-like protein [Calothrix parasitica NIES-267]|uniref:S-layer region-like protein n=1 Tax=Calothrix parasitica NIES-267 TaxID=1973488 RepID=A0A1Z4LU25_9CYAN|nr:S-layer region-like protein [Calothrix parasitica NIES-267]
MSKVLQALLTSSIIGTVLIFGSDGVAAQKIIDLESKYEVLDAKSNIHDETFNQEKLIAQVTSVSQLSDVQPTDWAFQALQSLVERYGCIAGYPNQTYRGNRALTRYEFAAGLNACLDRVNELIATATADIVTREDLAALQKLQEEFSAELATLRGRVDAVEARTAQLEANQFSTTSKLEGEVVTAVVDALEGETNEDNTTFGARARINFVTSFTGKDTLYTRIQTNNIVSPDIGTPEGNLAFGESSDDASTDAALDALWYSFPLTDKTNVIAIANAGAADDVVDTVNQFDGDGTEGAISAFGTRNPIYYNMDGSGLGITQEFGDSLALSLAYLGSSPNDPSSDNGIFNGPYGALAQLTFEPSKRFKVGLTYINAYNQELGTGSQRANPISFLQSTQVAPPGVPGEPEPVEVPFSSNSYGIQATLGISKNIVLGGWAGYTNATNLSTQGGRIDRGNLDIWNWAVTLGFKDLGKKGNLAGIIVGMEPRVTDSSINEIDEDSDTSYHIEAFYQFKVNDNIAITPGVVWLTAPDHNENNEDVVIGALRTTFTF